MLSNWPIFILAACILSVGLTLTFFNRDRESGIAFNFGLIVTASGTLMVGGLFVMFILSAVIGGLSGLPVQ